MAWVRVDDHFDEHPKMARVGPLGWGVWLAGLAYCNRNLTDGFIPWEVARHLVSFEIVADDGQLSTLSCTSGMDGNDIDMPWAIELMVDSGLWELKRKGDRITGYQVHDYTDYQPKRSEVLSERRRTADRQATFRERVKARNADSNAVTSSVVTPPVTPLSRRPQPQPQVVKKEKPSGAPWSHRACELWVERFGGTVNGGKIGKSLKPLIAKYGDQPVLAAWQRYLNGKEAEFASPADFATKYREWAEKRAARDPDPQLLSDLHELVLRSSSWLLFSETIKAEYDRLANEHPVLWTRAGPQFQELRHGVLVEAKADTFRLDRELTHQLRALRNGH